jgi:prepilin-type N-terminal cleavage/methylation domain-containing protein
MLLTRRQNRENERAFTMVELIVTLTIVALLSVIAAIAIFRVQENARAQLCRANMQLIEDAKDRWLKTHYGEGDPVQSDLASLMAGKTFPICPDHGTYSGFGINQSVQCSVHGAYRQVAAPQ